MTETVIDTFKRYTVSGRPRGAEVSIEVNEWDGWGRVTLYGAHDGEVVLCPEGLLLLHYVLENIVAEHPYNAEYDQPINESDE